MIDGKTFLYVLFGLTLVIAVGLQRRLKGSIFPLPLVYVFIGWAAFSLPLGLPSVDLLRDPEHTVFTELISEFIVIASLAVAGLAIDRPFSWKNWNQVWPLLFITMPLTILLVALFGWYMMELTVASCIFLAAVLSPTDPVLASNVQVGPPGARQRHDIRFGLTVEAGANDGLAFPFVHLAIAAMGATALGSWTVQWALEDLLWRVTAGVVIGLLTGRIGAWLVFTYVPEANKDGDSSQADDEKSFTSEGMITLGALLTSYGVAEAFHGYGFLAVFISAVTAKQYAPTSYYHAISHHFLEQIESILLVIILLIFGAFLTTDIMRNLTWEGALLGFLVVFLIRPLTGLVAQSRNSLPWYGRFTIAFLGVRGIGSLYYLSYGENHGRFGDTTTIWSAVMFTILLSIVVHGVTAPILMKKSEARSAHRSKEDSSKEV
ncbi:sodium:proton antiporter [Alteromonas pelagimontana]|uniref:Sodium:proton antiporter n=1 Tax=Alteromonas pelagimontana TaxID=1858656 RepID=A0A6M4ME39_9ALTE|nr:sodium:proton antiporter [Alteromonas pelagimontana]QJR81108.1 sodium:proton antiporter [Alteromonas pelagimontana]